MVSLRGAERFSFANGFLFSILSFKRSINFVFVLAPPEPLVDLVSGESEAGRDLVVASLRELSPFIPLFHQGFVLLGCLHPVDCLPQVTLPSRMFGLLYDLMCLHLIAWEGTDFRLADARLEVESHGSSWIPRLISLAAL